MLLLTGQELATAGNASCAPQHDRLNMLSQTPEKTCGYKYGQGLRW